MPLNSLVCTSAPGKSFHSLLSMISVFRFGGILFSAVCSDVLSVGASTAVYGLIGSYLAFVILNWTYLKFDTERRHNIIFFLCVSLLLSLITVSSGQRIDVLGHLGGFFTGVMLGLFLLPRLTRDNGGGTFSSPEFKQHESVACTGKMMLILFYATFLTCFYTLREPVAPGGLKS